MGGLFSKTPTIQIIYKRENGSLATENRPIDPEGILAVLKILEDCRKQNTPVALLKLTFEDKYSPGSMDLQLAKIIASKDAPPLQIETLDLDVNLDGEGSTRDANLLVFGTRLLSVLVALNVIVEKLSLSESLETDRARSERILLR